MDHKLNKSSTFLHFFLHHHQTRFKLKPPNKRADWQKFAGVNPLFKIVIFISLTTALNLGKDGTHCGSFGKTERRNNGGATIIEAFGTQT